MGKIDENYTLVKHLWNMPKGRILLDDTTKMCWKWPSSDEKVNPVMSLIFGEADFPMPSNYPESHHLK